VAPLGVDTMRFRPREEGVTPWPAPYILGVGRLLPIKGFDVLVRAAARLDMPLVLAGDGPQRRALLALAQQLGTDLRLTGHLGPDAVAAAMAGSAAVVIPSRTLGTREEGCPVVALEALAVGVPVLASATGGLVDLLPPECLFPPEDDEALAARLLTVMAAPRSPTLPDARCDRRHTARVLLDLLATTPGV
jgi:glycosyltransferase involved in cell wall biosynthesis